MNPITRLALISTAAAVLLAARRTKAGAVEDGGIIGAWGADVLIDRVEGLADVLTAAPAGVDESTAARNLAAFLQVLQRAEGTADQPDPYRTCYAYSHRISSLAEHPAVSGEWPGVNLSDDMCARAGFGPGCKSTAAGAYQLIRPTWTRMRDALGLPDFGAASQDAAAVELIRRRGALGDAMGGRLVEAVRKCRNEWASLPGNYARQGQRSVETLAGWFESAGGSIA